MTIDNPEAIRFANDARYLAEKTRALKAEIASFRARYDGGIGEFFFNHGNEAVDDGREAEGVSRLVGNDILAFNAQVLYDTLAVMNAVGYDVMLETLCVNPLRAG